MYLQLEIQLIAVIVACACAIPGVFLVLREMSMLSDSITHTILLGIVIAFFITGDLNSPYLIVGAAVVGVVTVYLTESLNKTNLLSKEASIGIIFPFLFSIAVILIGVKGDNVHIDTDTALLGELAFAPFDRITLWGVDIGAKSIYTMGAILVINILVVSIFYKELALSSFDSVLAGIMGFSPAILHYMLMSLVSITAVGAFSAVGSVLVVSFMIGPPITAYLLTNNLKNLIVLSCLIGTFNAIIGFNISVYFDVSIAGTIAATMGITFLIIFLFSTKKRFKINAPHRN